MLFLKQSLFYFVAINQQQLSDRIKNALNSKLKNISDANLSKMEQQNIHLLSISQTNGAQSSGTHGMLLMYQVIQKKVYVFCWL